LFDSRPLHFHPHGLDDTFVVPEMFYTLYYARYPENLRLSAQDLIFRNRHDVLGKNRMVSICNQR